MSTTPTLYIKEVADLYVRKNFQNLQNYFTGQNQLQDFKFMEIVASKALTNGRYAHGLGYTPKDVIVTQVTGAGQVTLNYGKFDAQFIDVTTTDACRIRLFVGSYWQDQSTVQAAATDAETFGMGESSSASATNIFTSLLDGLVPASGGGTSKFIRADGKWAIPPGMSIGAMGVMSTFTASGTFTTPASSSTSTIYEYFVLGGGGNGGNSTGGASSSGGGSGGLSLGTFTGLPPSTPLTVTVGGAGAASSISGTGITTITANPGAAGVNVGGVAGTAGGVGGTATGGAINIQGAQGGNCMIGFSNPLFLPGYGANGPFGGGGMAGGNNIGAGSSATAYGAGGGGSANGSVGGSGFQGIVIIRQLTP